MKPLTLKQLRNLLKKIMKKNPLGQQVILVNELLHADDYLSGKTDNQPRDPRTVLVEIGYKW